MALCWLLAFLILFGYAHFSSEIVIGVVVSDTHSFFSAMPSFVFVVVCSLMFLLCVVVGLVTKRWFFYYKSV